MRPRTVRWLAALVALFMVATMAWVAVRGTHAEDVAEAGEDMARAVGAVSAHYRPPAALAGPLTVMVTGAAGFIGSHVARALLARGDTVVVVDEFNDYYDVALKEANVRALQDEFGAARLHVVRADVADEAAMDEALRRHRPDVVCHLAARAGVRPSIEAPTAYVHANVLGTTVMLEMAQRHKVRNFVLASTSSAYGETEQVPFREDDRADRPVSPYAATKRACELLAYTYHQLYNIPVNVLRFFTVYGPAGRPDMAPYKFIRAVLRGEPIQRFGDGSSLRDYTYVSDIVDGVVAAIDRPHPFEIFNLGRGSPIKLNHFIQLIEEEVGKTAIIVEKPEQPGDVSRTHADCSKAKLMLGYRPKVSTREGIRRTVQWMRSRKL